MNRQVAAVTLAGVFLALATGCSARSSHGIDGEWTAEGGRRPHLTLHPSGQMTGHDGCNGFGGRWTVTEPGVIEFPEMVSSAKLCFDVPDQWLGAMHSATLEGDALVCRDPDGALLGTLYRALT